MKIKWWQGMLVAGVVAAIGIFVIYQSLAGDKYLPLKTYQNSDTQILQTAGLAKIGLVNTNKNAIVLPDNSKDKNPTTSANYIFNLPAGNYRLCQNGRANNRVNINTSLLINNSDATAGTIVKQINSTKSQVTELFCLNFDIPGKHWDKTAKIEYIVGVDSAAINQIFLTEFTISVNNNLNVSEKVLKNEIHLGEKCTGKNIVEGKITDQLGNPVPAHIGIDYDGATSTNTGYEENVYVNISKPQERNTYWCKSLPDGVKRVSIEIYSQRTYNTNDEVANNYLLFGNAMKHSVSIDGNGKTTVNLTLPNTCNSPGIPASTANTGRVVIKEIKVNDEIIDIEPKPDRLDNNLWRTNAWSRNLDPGVSIAGFSSLNTRKVNGKTMRADIIGRLASKQKYLIKAQVSRKNHDYKFEVPGVYVDPCGDTSMKVQITDKIYGNYDSKLTCVAKVNSPSKKEEEVNCSSIVEEPNKGRSADRSSGESEE